MRSFSWLIWAVLSAGAAWAEDKPPKIAGWKAAAEWAPSRNNVAAAPLSGPLPLIPVTPCRIADTRLGSLPFGAPALNGGETRSIPIPASSCGIPPTAQAYSLNFTVVPPGPLAFLTAWPTGQARPLVSTLNSFEGAIAANAAVVAAGTGGAINVFVSDRSDVIIDINGYFDSSAAIASQLPFYAVAPCRVVDTRDGQGTSGAFGPPVMTAGTTRTFPLPSGRCPLPANARAYSLNVTVVPRGPLSFLTIFPSGQARPAVSTLNSTRGIILANAATVPAGINGAIDVYVTDTSDVILDVNGYFAQ